MDLTTDAISKDRVIVDKSYLETLQQHCCRCPAASENFRTFAAKAYAPIRYQSSKVPEHRRDAFISKIPGPTEWRKRQVTLVKTKEQYEQVVGGFTSKRGIDIIDECSAGEPQSQNALVVIGIKFAEITNATIQSKELQEACANFQLFILLSYCSFLDDIGTRWEEIDKILQKISSTREKDRRRLMGRAVIINRLICDLVIGGWPICRATEIFFLSSLPATNLLSIRNEDFEKLPALLLEDRYIEYNFEDCFTTEYNIPMLLKGLLDKNNLAESYR